MSNKSIVEEALLEAKNIEMAIKKNSKGILAEAMKQDIDKIVKASITEAEAEEDEIEVSDELGTEDEIPGADSEISNDDSNEESEENEESSDADDISGEEGGEELPMDVSGEEVTDDLPAEISGEEGGEELPMDISGEEGGDDEFAFSDNDDVVDLTGASDDELLTVFKKMGDNDEIEVVKSGKNIDIKDKKTGAEYKIEMNESLDGMDECGEGMDECGDENDSQDFNFDSIDEMDLDLDSELSDIDASSDEEETLYEIEFSDEENMDELDSYNWDNPEKSSNSGMGADEGIRRTLADRRRRDLKPTTYPTKREMYESLKGKYKSVIKEHTELKSKYDQTKDALKVFRGKLNEIAVFNSNLAHVVKLFMEHSTTKKEKMLILNRFDENVSNLKESKKLYKTILTELEGRKPMVESVKEKLNETLTKGSSSIKESTAYVDPQISRIHDLMNRMENRS